ncbi:MAG: 6-carboxytetrahydropterin synthase [Chitinophagales bacterium]|nr:6-carboxytetrahydropterin synthase [Chitinophagales bacterium]MDW8274200.1 6-carboxytetrahydropterin synthase [Chitinophagales bacterium]
MRVAVFRKAQFNAAHRLYRKDWSDDKNNEVFGLCNNPNWHGHNYKLEVKLVGEIDPETGYVIDLKILNDIIQKQIIERFDHKNLNLDTEEFKDLIPTGENIVVVIYQLLRRSLDSKYDLTVRLWETDRNYFEYPA